jgi:Mn2+/Fe2+ NRAMP family transporter
MQGGEPRQGSPADRGKVVEWPHERAKREKRSGPQPPLASYGTGESFLRGLAPGIVTGAADVDPALVLTATVAGAAFGYSLLWVVVLCIPFLLNVFSVSGRIGHETHRGLVELLRIHYGRRIAISCAAVVVIINMAMIVADLLAVTDALSIILDQRRIFFVAAVAFAVWYILIFSNYQKITHALAVVSLPLLIYVVAAIFSNPPTKEVAIRTFVPHIYPTWQYTTAVVALFGSLLTPYILVWQTSSGSEDAKAGGEFDEVDHRMGTLVTTVLCFSVIVAAGTVLRGMVAGDLTTREAAAALTPAVGDWGPIVFAIGIIGSGMVALPVLVASLCYSVAEAMGWPYGLSENPWDARRFYVLISAALFMAAGLNFLRVNPVNALYWSQIMAGVLTIPILLFILVLSNDRRVMRSVNTRGQNFWIGAAAGGLCAAGLLVVWYRVSS